MDLRRQLASFKRRSLDLFDEEGLEVQDCELRLTKKGTDAQQAQLPILMHSEKSLRTCYLVALDSVVPCITDMMRSDCQGKFAAASSTCPLHRLQSKVVVVTAPSIDMLLVC